MKRKTTILLSALLLIFSVPWFFSGTPDSAILGFPNWALYSISMTLLYALVLIYLLGKRWEDMENE